MFAQDAVLEFRGEVQIAVQLAAKLQGVVEEAEGFRRKLSAEAEELDLCWWCVLANKNELESNCASTRDHFRGSCGELDVPFWQQGGQGAQGAGAGAVGGAGHPAGAAQQIRGPQYLSEAEQPGRSDA